MSQKNETPAFVLALFITIGLVGAGFWWLTRSSGLKLPQLGLTPSNTPHTSGSNQTGQSAGANFADVGSVPSGLFNYGGSTVWAPIRLVVDKTLQEARPEFRLRYVDPGSKPPSSAEGIRMVLNGELSFAQSSRPIRDEEYSQAQQRGFQLQQIAVAIDGLAIAVHPSLNIPGLTLEQLKGIYTGRIRNWQEIGGPNLPITPYSHPNTAGSPFEEKVLGNEQYGDNVQPIATTTQAIRLLTNNPGGIFYASAPELVPQCAVKSIPLGRTARDLVTPYQEPFAPLSDCPNQRNQLNVQAFQQGTYPLTRNLFVIVKQNGRLEEQAGEAYANLLLTNQGQELIEKAGFVRIR
jgi:phosphate transport system substrate-binding protein